MREDMEQFIDRGEAFAHYGVKGMQWGVRKQAIGTARSQMGKHERKLANAEQDFLKTRASGSKKESDKSLKNLNKTFKAREKNRLTAATNTRGEQFALGILGSALITPVGAAAVLGVSSFVTRDSQKIGDYPIKLLKNIAAD